MFICALVKSGDIYWAALDGTKSKPNLVSEITGKISFPAGSEDDSENLQQFWQILQQRLSESKAIGRIDNIVLRQYASKGKFAAGPNSVKVEGLIQLASINAGIKCIFQHPASLLTAVKSYSKEFRVSPETLIAFKGTHWNAGLKDACLHAWSFLPLN